MGLDFEIKRKRSGEAYKSDAWDTIAYGRNCHKVRDIVLSNISTYNKKTMEAKLTIGTLNNLIVKLAESLNQYNLNDDYTFENDDYTKTLNFLSELSKGVYEHCVDYEYDGIEYNYILIDSF